MNGKFALLLCAAAMMAGCVSERPNYEWVTRNPQTLRLHAPPPGKALVNFHRNWGAFTYALYNRDGVFLCDVPPYGEFQYVLPSHISIASS